MLINPEIVVDGALNAIPSHRIYYDRSRTCHSPDAADAKVTVRVLTVMLSSEY